MAYGTVMRNHVRSERLRLIREERSMAMGADGCYRCGGFVIETTDAIPSESYEIPCLKCLNCGARRYLEVISGPELSEIRKGRSRKPREAV